MMILITKQLSNPLLVGCLMAERFDAALHPHTADGLLCEES